VQIGDKIYALGNPLGVLQNTLSEGIISGIRQGDGYRLFQLTSPISHGSSGGPVFNTNGEVVGIVELTIEEGQNLNFAIPIDYAAGMLGSRNVQPLASIYEPESPTAERSPAAQQASVATPSASMKSDAFTYISGKMGIWSKEDAEKELGESIDRRDAIFNGAVIGDIYKYACPQPGFSAVELNFNRASKRLAAAYFYYASLVPWVSVKAKLGRHYKKMKMENGQPGYLYQFQQRQVFVLVDSAENVVSIGVW
jgi:hypothetical protein